MKLRHLSKHTQREYRPWYVFYAPIFLYRIRLSLKSRHPLFFSAANPGMVMGWFYGYGKRDVLQQLDQNLIPTTIHIDHQHSYSEIIKLIDDSQISYPLIIKPNKSNRGTGVYKLRTPESLRKILASGYGLLYHRDILIQSHIDLPLEFGVMRYRIPGEQTGHISWIVQKWLLSITGDGTHTIEQLIKKHPRARYYEWSIQEHFDGSVQTIPAHDETIKLVEIWNHCKWTTFFDASHLVNDELIKTFDAIADQVSWFYFGRFDLRVQSIQDLYQWTIKIMEINGVESEPAHIYDPDNPLWSAYRTLFGHWKVLHRISSINRQSGKRYMSIADAYRIFTKQPISPT